MNFFFPFEEKKKKENNIFSQWLGCNAIRLLNILKIYIKNIILLYYIEYYSKIKKKKKK